MVRILLLNQRDPAHPASGGAELHLQEVFSRLAQGEHRITWAACRFPGAPREERIRGLEVRRLATPLLYYAAAARYCARETVRGRFDAVVECLNKVPFYARLYSRKPVLALCHHLFGTVAFRQLPWPLAAGVWLAEHPLPWLYRDVPFVAISESSRRDLVARGVSDDQIRVIPCGGYRPAADLPAAEVRVPRVVYLGRLEPYKRVDVLLRAAARLRPRQPQLEVVILGRGRARHRLERLAERLGIADRVRFTGYLDDAARDALLATARVAVCPSAKEGWALTVIECNALGVPVVASDVAGLRDSVRHGETGLLVPYGDDVAFADAIGRILDDDTLATELSRASRSWAARFDWDDAARRTGELIGELCTSEGARS